MFASGALRQAVLLAAAMSLLSVGTASAETLHAAPARSFANSVGVNVHPTYLTTPYRDSPRVIAELERLGVRHVRHAIDAQTRADQLWVNARLEGFVRRLAARDIKVDFLVGDPGRSAPIARQFAHLRDHLLAGAESIEGPNEWDIKGDPDWAATLRGYQRELYAAVKSDPALRGLPVLAPSLGRFGRLRELGDLSPWTDRGNLHAYAGGQAPGQSWLDDQMAAARSVTGGEPVVLTETGYHDGLAYSGGHRPVTEGVAGAYLPRLLLESFRRGVARSFLYELVDERSDPGRTDMEQHFGLLRHDWSPKPAARALRNLMAIAGGAAAYGSEAAGGSLELQLTGAAAQARRLALRRPDGSIVLFLWQDTKLWDERGARTFAPPALGGRLSISGAFGRVEQYRVGRSARVVASRRLRAQMPVSVPAADIVALRLSPAAARAAGRRARRHARDRRR